MHRRSFLSVAAAGVLAGCLGGVGSDDGGLAVASVATEETDAGDLVGIVTVENTAPDTTSGTLIGQVDFEEGDVYTERREVTVQGGRSNTYELEFAIDEPKPPKGSGYRFSADLE